MMLAVMHDGCGKVVAVLTVSDDLKVWEVAICYAHALLCIFVAYPRN